VTSILLPNPETVSTIGKAMKLQGCIRLEENLVVAGYVEGPLNIKGHLEVDAGGVIRGDVVADSITIAGTVIGNIRSRKGLKVLDGARVHGDIRSPSVSLSHRAQHRGNVSIVETMAERKQT
jgi:cytoskeletal protein CcmA (bactofilin family)